MSLLLYEIIISSLSLKEISSCKILYIAMRSVDRLCNNFPLLKLRARARRLTSKEYGESIVILRSNMQLLKCRKSLSETFVIICAKVCVSISSRTRRGCESNSVKLYFVRFVCTYIICISMYVCMCVRTRVLRTYSSRSRCGRVAGPSGNTASSWDTTL